MRIKSRNILYIISIWTAVLFPIIAFLPDNILRVVVSLPAILFFPGYTLLATLFPRKGGLKDIERFALGCGISLAVVAITGLILNYTLGLSLNSVLYSLVAFVVIASIIAMIRQRDLPDAEKDFFAISFAWWGKQSILERILSVILILVVCGTIGVLIYTIAVPKTGSAYSELYVLNSQGVADNYPSDIKAGDTGNVILVIINHENRMAVYRIEVQIDNDSNDGIDPVTLGTIDNITLENEQKYETHASFTPQITGDGQKVYFILFKDGETEPYLEVNLTVNVN